ncbi:UNVERIFIED_CONTAM: hypothetical protein Sradi_4130200 [Sesamum radiatum]|uniref:Uncharacterized protein n=1 Tax=Sesamum radiatum TaxID=300843 RepID=A0AAW2P3S0_SESRA
MPPRPLRGGRSLTLPLTEVAEGGVSVRPLVVFYMNPQKRRKKMMRRRKGSSQGEGDPRLGGSKVPQGTRGSCPSGSDWVSCLLSWDEVNQLVKKFAISSDFTVLFPSLKAILVCLRSNNMSLFSSQLRVGLQFPIPLFYCEVSCHFQVPLNQLRVTEERHLSHFGLSPRAEPLGNRWWVIIFADDIIFSKLLKDEHRAATTPPNTRSSRGISSFGDKRGKQSAAILPGSSSKRPKSSSSAAPPASSTRYASTPPPRDSGGGSFHSPSSPVGGVYAHLLLESGREAASSRATYILKGSLLLLTDASYPRYPVKTWTGCYHWCLRTCLSKFKKSEDYKKEMALVAEPYLHFAFEASLQQFLAHGYPPIGEETAFVNFDMVLDTASNPFDQSVPVRAHPPIDSKDLDQILEVVEAEVSGDTDHVPKVVMREGAPEGILFKPMVKDVPDPS